MMKSNKLASFKKLYKYILKHPDANVDELVSIDEAIRYFKRLKGKTLQDIKDAMGTDYKQVTIIASPSIHGNLLPHRTQRPKCSCSPQITCYTFNKIRTCSSQQSDLRVSGMPASASVRPPQNGRE